MTCDHDELEAIEFQNDLQVQLQNELDEGTDPTDLVSVLMVEATRLMVHVVGLEQAHRDLDEVVEELHDSMWHAVEQEGQLN